MKRYALRLIVRADVVGLIPVSLIDILNHIGTRTTLGDGEGFEWTCEVKKRFSLMGIITQLTELNIGFVATSVLLFAQNELKHEGAESRPGRLVRAYVGSWDDTRCDDRS